MRAFACQVCGNLLSFENNLCVRCTTPQGFDPAANLLVPVLQAVPALVPCANAGIAQCNWLAEPERGLCVSCRLTRTRPADSDDEGMAAFARAENAKRRLVYQLRDLGLPVVGKDEDPQAGLAFDLLSSKDENVITGHADGVVTIDLAEGEDAHREAMRVQMGEPYRTMLGHLRHEVGHYYWQVLVQGNGLASTGGDATLARFRGLFGDDRLDYARALEKHYSRGPADTWAPTHVSAYATAHPWEDWAETFAHYLHIRDTIQTASSWGLVVTGPQVLPPDPTLIALPMDEVDDDGVKELVATWLPLTYALNAVNRSMGRDDLYPFMLTPMVIAKVAFVHELVTRAGLRTAGAPAA